ncbi:Gfo/Idh/MocA family oxidoreductase [Vibrio sp. SM6]|uniref:Gfo/Idh/MocA family oxidoreductase n=1 Tax=Vibrio agarilyticus TaxID=2726741 RepID=A0A7X8YG25_9VIBR|nr:Gfo/Idh/MocA family oxidoreductase [Vibrio agarilyticus]NLS11966.1 Gfo/Idh/MocA family oxidoreductase [Vibrio agarilyticus]
MTNSEFNWGIIAPGRIAHNFAKALTVVPNARLYAVASSNRERAQAFSQTYACNRIYDNYQALIDDPNVDAIYIANPHRFHFEWAMRCLLANKPVLCEKPLTVTAKQTQTLIELAKQQNTFLMEAVWTRFLPAWRQVSTWLSEKRIGELNVLRSSFSFKATRDDNDRLFNKDLAGGALLDVGIYNLTMSQFALQREPETILANGLIGKTGVDERTSVILNYNGISSEFTCGLNCTLENQFILYGDKGSITIPTPFWAATQAILRVDGEPECMIELPFRATGFEYQIEEVMHCIARGELQSNIMPWQDSLNTMKTMDAIRAQIGLDYPFV